MTPKGPVLDLDPTDVAELDFSEGQETRHLHPSIDEGWMCPVDRVPLWHRRGVNGIACPVCHRTLSQLGLE